MQMDSDIPVDVEEIVVHGNRRTKTSYFVSCLKDSAIISKTSDKSLRTYISDLQKLNRQLLASNLFDNVDGDLQIQSRSGGRYKANIVLTVKEKGIPYINAQSYVSTGDKSDVGFELQAALRSPFGHGEQLRISSINSATGNREYAAHLHIPHAEGDWNLACKSGAEQQLSWITYQQAMQTLQLQYKPHISSPHQVIAEYSLRNEIPIAQQGSRGGSLGRLTSLLSSELHNASNAVINCSTSSIKSSIKHLWTHVNESSTEQGGSSSFLQSSVEVAAGLSASSAEFLKADVQGRYETLIGPQLFKQEGLKLSFAGSMGVMYPLGLLVPWLSRQHLQSRPYNSYLSDRYQLGGPLSLRGFLPAGVGPRVADRVDSLGGDTKSSFLAMLSVPVPHSQLAEAQMRAFTFVNIGSLGNSVYWNIQSNNNEGEATSIQGKYAPLFGYFRGSVGAGLSVNIGGAAKLEATYSYPILKANHDLTRSFQIGIGVTLN